jgi:hypothetical protein
MKAVFQTTITPEKAEEMARHEAERHAHYVALYGRDSELARLNAQWDARGKFRNVEYARAVLGLFNAARAGGPDFILGGEG